MPPPGHVAAFPEHTIVPTLPEDEEELEEDELLDEELDAHIGPPPGVSKQC